MGQRLTDTEALLWSLGRDPHLASTMGLVAVLESRPDPDRFRATMAGAVAAMSRLQQRVHDPAGSRPILIDTVAAARPEWVVDRWFDLDHHVRVIRLAGARSGAATDAELRRAAAQFINDPFDTTRPLWQFQLVLGLRGGRAAVLGKVHHSISDGIGLLKLAASLLELEPGAAPPSPVDLDEVIAAAAAAEEADGGATATTAQADQGNGTGGGAGLRGWLREAAELVTAPVELLEAGVDVLTSARTLGQQLPKAEASELWATRSRNRRLELLRLPLDSLQGRAAALDATVNDVFVAACAEAAVAYHRHHGAPLATVSATVVISTAPLPPGGGLGDPSGPTAQLGDHDNAFVPVAIAIPGDDADPLDRLRVIQDEVRARRAAIAERGHVVERITALGGLVPSSVAAALALDQASKVDIATSNIPGVPVPTWLAGQRVTSIHPVGPVAGTAVNVTLMSYDSQICLGIHLDPAAVQDASLFTASLRDGFGAFGVARR